MAIPNQPRNGRLRCRSYLNGNSSSVFLHVSIPGLFWKECCYLQHLQNLCFFDYHITAFLLIWGSNNLRLSTSVTVYCVSAKWEKREMSQGRYKQLLHQCMLAAQFSLLHSSHRVAMILIYLEEGGKPFWMKFSTLKRALANFHSEKF